jgi:hypothetical protein
LAQRSYSQNEFIRNSREAKKWLENYLFKRRQKIINKNYWSNFELVSAGVPQGSVLNPLMFLIYINDIGEKLISLSRLFADDTSIKRKFDVVYVIGEKQDFCFFGIE